MAITVSGTSITFNDATTQSTAATGTVTSVATGNGLSGGTITTTGTLTIAAPSFNTVGSYVFAYTDGTLITAGSNYAGNSKVLCYSVDSGNTQATTTAISGTWKWMAATTINNGTPMNGIIVRVA